MKKFIVMVLMSAVSLAGFANNIKIDSAPSLVSQDVSAGANSSANFNYIQFDMSWENSWRDPINWDAAWVFVKYKVGSGNWQHATLSAVDAQHSITADNGSPASIKAVTGGYGVFVYRSGNGNGTLNLDGIRLRWNYGANGVSDNAIVTVKVFAIEMVQVPTGSFTCGDYGGNSVFLNTLINTGNATQTPVYNNGVYEGGSPYGYTSSGGAMFTTPQLPVNATYPNGYNGYYMMKYELTQDAYVDFLNTLTRNQQASHVQTNITTGVTSVTNRYVMSNSATVAYRNGIRCDASISGSAPVVFYCDLDADGTSVNGLANEAGDGQVIPVNYVNWSDLTAYMDWSGLRPLTELEFEKACRGNQAIVPSEYAWGTNSIAFSQYTYTNNAQANEQIATNYSTTIGNGNAVTIGTMPAVPNNGPCRTGIFAGNVNNTTDYRVRAGAGYYGAMELTGNLTEMLVVHTSSGYTGESGDGILDATGNATITNLSNVGFAGMRGADFTTVVSAVFMASRANATTFPSVRAQYLGIRGGRTVQ